MPLVMTVSAEALKAALGSVRGAVASRPDRLILACVHITADAGGVVLTTQDGVKAMATGLAAEIADYGEVAVDFAKLFAVAGVASGTLSIKYVAKGQRLEVSHSGGRHTLACLDVADWPPVRWTADEDGAFDSEAVVADGASWAAALGVVSHASTDFNRYGLYGVHVERVGEDLRLVTTDGSRLAWGAVDVSLPMGDLRLPRRQLIPPDVARLMGRNAAAGGLWGLRFGGRVMLWTPVDADGKPAPGVKLRAQMVEGEFPDYRLVIPPGFKRAVKVKTADLEAGLKVVGLASTDRNNSVRAAFEEGRVYLSATSAKGSEQASASIPAEVDGAPVSTGFNGLLLGEALAYLGAPEVWLTLGEALDPCIITVVEPKERADAAKLVVVMPMRLD